MSSKVKCEIELFKSLLEQTSARSDNFAYNKNDGILMFGRGVNASRNKANRTWLDNGGNKPEVKDIG
ncbi:hypothetical protein NY78_2154 [Desulfovibrio sp. TomC]|nr:hypothetical protein NY78_2154 [Desulfovibrio sp. TomC]